MALRIAGVFLGLFVLASAASADERKGGDTRFKIAAAVLVGLGAADVVQTGSCLQAGICTEVNPIARKLNSDYGTLAVTKGAALSLAIWPTWKARKSHPKLAWSVLLAVTAAQGFVVASNARQLGKARR